MLFLGGQGLEQDIEDYSTNLVLPNLTASQVIDSLSEWDGLENTVALFQDLVISESGKYTLLFHCILHASQSLTLF